MNSRRELMQNFDRHGVVNSFLFILLSLALCFIALFFASTDGGKLVINLGHLHLMLDKFSLFIASIFALSLFMGLYPLKDELDIQPSFGFYLLGGLGIILAQNLLTFSLFWLFQRALPALRFIKNIRTSESTAGGTYIFQHLFTFLCLLALAFLAFQSGFLFSAFDDIPASFFNWPVLLLSFIIIYASHGIFPFHSWVHDVVGQFGWYKISALFLSRAGVILFVKLLLPHFSTEPDSFKIALLLFSIFSSIYWTMRGIYETNVSQITTYLYVAQSSLILTGLQADFTATRGAYLHLMVISLSGTALWSVISYIQRHTSIKRLHQFYGLAKNYPRLSTLFALFGFCMIGTPLGASFVVEDLVINGLLDKWPYLGLFHILATCLNGILFFMVFFRLFLGSPSFPRSEKNLDMSLGQMLPYVFVLMLMFAIGIYPSFILGHFNW